MRCFAVVTVSAGHPLLLLSLLKGLLCLNQSTTVVLIPLLKGQTPRRGSCLILAATHSNSPGVCVLVQIVQMGIGTHSLIWSLPEGVTLSNDSTSNFSQEHLVCLCAWHLIKILVCISIPIKHLWRLFKTCIIYTHVSAVVFLAGIYITYKTSVTMHVRCACDANKTHSSKPPQGTLSFLLSPLRDVNGNSIPSADFQNSRDDILDIALIVLILSSSPFCFQHSAEENQ